MWQWFFLEFRLRRYPSSKYDSRIRLGLIEPQNSLFFFLLDLNLDRQGLVIAFYKFALVVRRGSTPMCAWRANPEEFYCIGRCTSPSSINIEHALVVQNHIPFVRDFAILNTLWPSNRIDLLNRTTITTFFKRNMPIQRSPDNHHENK